MNGQVTLIVPSPVAIFIIYIQKLDIIRTVFKNTEIKLFEKLILY
jgi:hypothetical protein